MKTMNRVLGHFCIGVVWVTGAIVVISLAALITSGFVCAFFADLADKLEETK